METLLIEIGTEEIPAGYIEPALAVLAETLTKELAAARIDHGQVETFGTPRRLAVRIGDVAEKQQSLSSRVLGPPKSVGFDDTGKPTVAAEKFAEKVGVPVDKLEITETEKGLYLSAEKKEIGQDSRDVLRKLIPDSIKSVSFPKTMRWANLDVSFARPIQSILALLGTEVIPFTFGNIESGREVFGHRFKHPETIQIQTPEEYVPALEAAWVQPLIRMRKEKIQSDIDSVAAELGGAVLQDDELLDIVTNLVEYSAPVAGTFEEKFIELPDEVLITAMREHQKYFAVVDPDGRLKPCFIAVNNTPAKDMNLVAKGHERVIRARLEDARFFFQSDRSNSLEDWVVQLKGVLFQAKLGSMYDKVERVKALVGFLGDAASLGSDEKQSAARAAWLCKADLVSQMVGEFPKLQGVMGRVYASVAGESPEVAAAIEEHYRPVHSGAPLPGSVCGAVVSIADKIDSICGCFSAGLIPTGASDPYALRRQGIGVIQIILNQNFKFSLLSLIKESLSHFGVTDNGETAESVFSFLKNRMSHMLAEEGFSKEVIAAVLSVPADVIPDVWNRVKALESLKAKPDFEPLAIAFKRAVNIIRKAELTEDASVDPALFEDACESALFTALQGIRAKAKTELDSSDFSQALLTIATLREPVDAFFDGVMVMADDIKIRCNRLALLKQIADLFAEFADFSKI